MAKHEARVNPLPWQLMRVSGYDVPANTVAFFSVTRGRIEAPINPMRTRGGSNRNGYHSAATAGMDDSEFDYDSADILHISGRFGPLFGMGAYRTFRRFIGFAAN